MAHRHARAGVKLGRMYKESNCDGRVFEATKKHGRRKLERHLPHFVLSTPEPLFNTFPTSLLARAMACYGTWRLRELVGSGSLLLGLK